MAYHHSQYRGDLAVPAAGKNDGNENWDLANHPYKAFKEPDGEHHGAITGTIEYFDGEFYVRVFVGGRDWHFRALDIDTLRDQVRRFFSAERGRVRLTLSKRADLARYGEASAIARL